MINDSSAFPLLCRVNINPSISCGWPGGVDTLFPVSWVLNVCCTSQEDLFSIHPFTRALPLPPPVPPCPGPLLNSEAHPPSSGPKLLLFLKDLHQDSISAQR